METNKKTLFLNSLTFGALTGIALILLSTLIYLLGMDNKSPLQYLTYVIFIVGIAWGTKYYKDVNLRGFISYGTSFLSGFYIGIIAGAIASVFTFILVKWVDPIIINKILEQAEEKLIEKYPDWPQQQLDSAMAMTKKFTTPVWMASLSFLSNTIVSVILSLIIAIFMKKKDESFEGFVENN